MTNRQVYDTVFRDYFNNTSRLLSLCNAVLDTGYGSPKDVLINTLEGTFFSNAKNDISCLLHNRFIVLMEHQHTVNNNMPLRMLIYATRLYEQHIAPLKKRLYAPATVPLPRPEFFVFYDGTRNEAEQRTLRLSDAFGGASHALELAVRLYNIGAGKNTALKNRCEALAHYSILVNRIHESMASGMPQGNAVREAIRYCKANGIMADYLASKEKEVFTMLDYEWKEDEAREAWTEYGIERGIERGIEQGIERGIEQGQRSALTSTVINLLKMGMSVRSIMNVVPWQREQIEKIAHANNLPIS